MPILSELILPFDYKYSSVLQLVSIVAHTMFYFYLLWVAGTIILSYYFEFVKRDDASNYFAKLILNLPLKNLYFPLVLGVIPFVVIISIDFIWLTGSEFSSVHAWTLINFLLFLISLYSLNVYKNTFDLIYVLSKSITDKESKEYLSLMETNLRKHKTSAKIGLVGIIFTIYLLSILIIAKLDYSQNDFRFDFFVYLFNLDVFVRFMYLIVVSFSITFLAILFFNFGWEETTTNLSEGLSDFIKTYSLKGAIATIIVQPIFLLLELLLFPRVGLSYIVFLSSGLAVILIFLISNQLNAYTKEINLFYLKYSFFLFIVVLFAVSTRDVVALGNVLKPKTVEISQKFVAYEENMRSKLNIKTVSINAEEIYTAKCSACHKFDEKLVGPPYNIVLKKYENNRDQLVKFILNPVKVDPAYPPMPAQGLIPPEAEAVADYILKIYRESSN